MENKCPKCKSSNTYVDKKGFSGKQAVAGAIIAGPLGVAAGTINSNKIKITCLSCGYSYQAGDCNKELSKLNPPKQDFTAGGFALFSFFFALIALIIWAIFNSLFFGIMSIVFACAFAVSLIISLANTKSNKNKSDPRQKEYNKLFGGDNN